MTPLAIAFPARRAIEGIRRLERFYALAQTGAVPLADFSRLHSMALESLRGIASIAREYPLTQEQDDAVGAAVRRIEGFTASMLPDPEPRQPAERPWWTWGLAAAGGAALALLGAALFSSSKDSPARGGNSMRGALAEAGQATAGVGRHEATMLLLAVLSTALGLGAWEHRETPLGSLTLGAASSMAGVSLTMLIAGVVED